MGARTAAVLVSSPSKVCAPCRASSIWSVISLNEVSTWLRSRAISRCRFLGMVVRCTRVGGVITPIPALAISVANRLPVNPLSCSNASMAAPSPVTRSAPIWRSPGVSLTYSPGLLPLRVNPWLAVLGVAGCGVRTIAPTRDPAWLTASYVS